MGSPALKGAADFVLEGSGPASVAHSIRSVVALVEQRYAFCPDKAGL